LIERGIVEMKTFESWYIVLFLLVIWQFSVSAELASPLLLASPLDISLWMASNLSNNQLWTDIIATVQRVIISFLFSALIGVPIGMLMGYFSKLETMLRLPVDFGRSIPATALFPLFMLFLGIGESSRIAVAIYGSSLIVLVNTVSGVKQANKNRIKTAKAYGATGWNLLIYILLPEAMPSIITGFRLGISLSFVIIILVEMFIGTTTGIGHRIIESQMLFEIPQMYSCIIFAGMFGYAMNSVFLFIEHKIGHYIGH